MLERKFICMKSLLWIAAIYIVLEFAIRFGIINSYWHGILDLTLINVILVVSLNLATGFLGQLTLAHSGFMAIGAYTCASVTKFLSASGWLEFPFALLCGGLFAMLVAFIISIPAMKIAGNYLVIITLAVNEIIRNLIINLNIGNGASGLHGIPAYSNFTISFFCAAFVITIIYLLINSKYGRAIVCIPQNEMLAKSCSINTFGYKLAAFSLAAFFAGIAGGLYAHELTVIEPNMFNYSYSVELLAMVIIGGLGSISGSIICAIVLTILPYVFSFAFDFKTAIFLAAMIFIMMRMPNGFFANYKIYLQKLFSLLKAKDFLNLKKAR